MEEQKTVSVPQRVHPLLKKNAALKALTTGAGSVIGACAIAAACGWKNPGALGKVTVGCLLGVGLDITKQAIEDKRDDRPINKTVAVTAFAKGVVTSAAIMAVSVLIVSFLNRGNKDG